MARKTSGSEFGIFNGVDIYRKLLPAQDVKFGQSVERMVVVFMSLAVAMTALKH